MNNTHPVRISIVSYLNSLPFLHGLKTHAIHREIEISQDYPAICAEKLASGNVDIGLIPAATLPAIPNGRIVGDYCIGCDGEVFSVLLLSHVPLPQIKKIILDYQSRTSVQLVRILAEKLWKIEPGWEAARPGFENEITGATAAVVIGDRAMNIRSGFPYVYDLGEAWKELTGLPFVFAVWVASKETENGFVARFNEALSSGIRAIPELTSRLTLPHTDKTSIERYLQQYIRYEFGPKQREGLECFLRFLKESANS